MEYERGGLDRAGYGDRLMETIARTLSDKGISRCDRSALYRYRSFYLAYPGAAAAAAPQHLPTTLREIVATPSPQSPLGPDRGTNATRLLSRLSYSHFELLVGVGEPDKRGFYEQRCLRGTWSVRELKRQIDSLLYERTALSTNKAALQGKTDEAAEAEPAGLVIRDPYIFEFLGLRPSEVMGESELEDALTDKLQSLLLELGHAFCLRRVRGACLSGTPMTSWTSSSTIGSSSVTCWSS